MMRGEFDNELKWPFRGEVTTQLLSQDGTHHTVVMSLADDCIFRRVTKGERNDSGMGKTEFITCKDCERFVQNDSLYFRIMNVTRL